MSLPRLDIGCEQYVVPSGAIVILAAASASPGYGLELLIVELNPFVFGEFQNLVLGFACLDLGDLLLG